MLLADGDVRLPFERKVLNDDGDPPTEELEQLDRNCTTLRVDTGWLIVFDQRSTATGTRLEPEEVITPGGRKLLVVRA